jgi:PST family polysaccharide transporter
VAIIARAPEGELDVAPSVEPVSPAGSLARTMRASLALGGGSIASVLVALVLNKIMASLVGPAGVGFYGLLQNLMVFGVMLAGLGLGTIVVRVGAAPPPSPVPHDAQWYAAVGRAAWRVTAVLWLATAAVMVLGRRLIAGAMLGDVRQDGAVLLACLGMAFGAATALQLGLLNMHRKLRVLAVSGVAMGVAGAVPTVALLMAWREAALPVAAVGYVVAAWCAVTALGWVHLRRRATSGRPDASAVRAATRDLVRLGLPYTGSMIASTGVQLLMPALVLHMLGSESVGFQRAATSISTAYFGVLLAAMARVYYPELAAAGGDRGALRRLVDRQQSLVMLIGTPIVLSCIAAGPFIIPLVYAPSFGPAVRILDWQLVGELFRFSSWSLAYVVLARCSGWAYFGTELVAGATALLSTLAAARLFGLPGLGVAYMLTYAVYLLTTYCVVRWKVGTVWSVRNLGPVMVGVAAAVALVALGTSRYAGLKLPIGTAAAVAAWAVCAVRMRDLLRRERDAGRTPA